MVIALFLALVGVQQVEFGNDYYLFMSSVARTYESWSFEIPKIPNVPKVPYGDGDTNEKSGILKVLISIVNFFVIIINAGITVINVLITVMNVVITLIQFCLSIVYSCKDFIDSHRNVIAYV